MNRLLESVKPNCPCGNDDLVYKGLGEFACMRCGRHVLNDYGRVHDYVEKHPNASVTEVSMATGVEEILIADMVAAHRLVAVGDARLHIKCKICGEPIIMGDYCEMCRSKRMENLASRGRQIFNPDEPKRERKFIGTAVNKDGDKGKRRFI